MSKKQINAAIRDAEACFDNTMSRTAINRRLRALGWKKLGTGSFALVLKHDDYPKVVIRLANRISRSINSWDGFQEYADLIIGGHISSKYHPKVHHLHLGDFNLTSIAVVERLYKIKNIDFCKQAYGTRDEIEYEGGWGEDYSLKGRAKAVLIEIKNYIPNSYIDLHHHNIMQRADGTPVFSDPVVIKRFA